MTYTNNSSTTQIPPQQVLQPSQQVRHGHTSDNTD